MKRITLVHWKAEEAAPLAERLRGLGYSVSVHSKQGSHSSLRRNPPAAFVIDLGRLPSHGREVGSWLRRQKDTRPVPLVFVGGKEDKVARLRELLPDAVFTEWEVMDEALAEAIASPPEQPVRIKNSTVYSISTSRK